VLAATFEKRMSDTRTWRTDSSAQAGLYELREIREDARTWLTFLATLGYPLAGVEQALVDNEPYQEREVGAADEQAKAQQDAEDTPDGESAEDSANAS